MPTLSITERLWDVDAVYVLRMQGLQVTAFEPTQPGRPA